MREGCLAADKVIHVHQGVKSLPPHEPCDHASDMDAGRAGRPAAEGERDFDVPLPIDQYAEEGLCKGVGLELTVGPGHIGAPEIGTAALPDESRPEVRDAWEPI